STVYLASRVFNNSSLYDPYWSVAPPLILSAWIFSSPQGFSLEAVVLLVVIIIWSIRLTVNWALSWRGMGQEDWRYRGFRETTGSWYWTVSFFAIHLFPTLIVYFALTPAYALLQSLQRYEGKLPPLALLGTAVILSGTLISHISDSQMRRFKRENGGSAVMTEGLWGLSRHPNYLGENMVWIGLWIYSVEAAGIITLICPATMLVLFLGYSIPAMEKKVVSSRPEYREVQQLIPRLLILPGRFTSRRKQEE
ncbi:MAG: DUF1295 domain-containing protein, partial [Spirochaetales bacterium]|nr:DUF1295 domain-containing protein [Spirochaetales bacterium]